MELPGQVGGLALFLQTPHGILRIARGLWGQMPSLGRAVISQVRKVLS
jgi:hypothetical protein